MQPRRAREKQIRRLGHDLERVVKWRRTCGNGWKGNGSTGDAGAGSRRRGSAAVHGEEKRTSRARERKGRGRIRPLGPKGRERAGGQTRGREGGLTSGAHATEREGGRERGKGRRHSGPTCHRVRGEEPSRAAKESGDGPESRFSAQKEIELIFFLLNRIKSK